ncbi:MAG: NUDIX domain-containing protein [Treponema sp.]|nr:NUDIX domain-containing protein [Treponema sp.]
METSPEPARSVAGIAVNEGRILIARRNPGGSLGGKWEFPGGKAEPGESDRAALEREYLEEFAVGIEVGPLLASSSFVHGGRRFLLNAYRITLAHTGLTLREHSDWRWIMPTEIEAGIPDGGFADSDLALLPDLKKALAGQ